MLTGLGLQLGSGEVIRGERLTEAQRIVNDLTDQVRQLSMNLRPAALDRYGLLPALRWHLERYERQTGVRVELRHEGMERRFPPAIEITAYRVVQEALTNVARHSGSTSAIVQCLAEPGVLLVSVIDRGQGFDPEAARQGSGLRGMQERVELLGGSVTVDTVPGTGVVVNAEIPLGDGETKDGTA